MNTKLLLFILSLSFIRAEPPVPDVLRVEGLKDIPCKIELVHKVAVSSSTTNKLAGLGFTLLGGVTLAGSVFLYDLPHDSLNFIKGASASILLMSIGILMDTENKQGTPDETTEKDKPLPDDHDASELLANNLSG